MEELAKQINAALDRDFPGVNLKHKVVNGDTKDQPTTTEQINATIAEFQALIRVLEKVRDRL